LPFSKVMNRPPEAFTDLLIISRQDSVETLNWYAMRWKHRNLHKILKSGCKAEDVKLRNAERLRPVS